MTGPRVSTPAEADCGLGKEGPPRNAGDETDSIGWLLRSPARLLNDVMSPAVVVSIFEAIEFVRSVETPNGEAARCEAVIRFGTVFEATAAWRPCRSFGNGLTEADLPVDARADIWLQKDLACCDTGCWPGSACVLVGSAGAGGGRGSGGMECPAPGSGGTGDNSGSGSYSAGESSNGSSSSG